MANRIRTGDPLGFNKVLYTVMREEGRTTLLYKNIFVFLFFRKELKLLWFVRQTDGGDKDRLLYWPLASSLDHSTLCYLRNPLSTSSASRPGLLNQRPGIGHRPQREHSQWLQAGFDSGLHCLQLSQLEAAQLDAAAPSGTLSLTATWLSLWPSLSPQLTQLLRTSACIIS